VKHPPRSVQFFLPSIGGVILQLLPSAIVVVIILVGNGIEFRGDLQSLKTRGNLVDLIRGREWWELVDLAWVWWISFLERGREWGSKTVWF
jgi:hypothetical protein